MGTHHSLTTLIVHSQRIWLSTKVAKARMKRKADVWIELCLDDACLCLILSLCECVIRLPNVTGPTEQITGSFCFVFFLCIQSHHHRRRCWLTQLDPRDDQWFDWPNVCELEYWNGQIELKSGQNAFVFTPIVTTSSRDTIAMFAKFE